MDSERVGRAAFVRYRGGAVGDDLIDDCSQGEPVRVVLGCLLYTSRCV